MRTFATPVLLGLTCFLIYNANLRQIGAGDTLPARYLPLILWHDRTLDLDANARLVAHGRSITPEWERPADRNVTYFEPWAFWMVRNRENQLVSMYPVVTPLLVAPLYIPAVVWLNAHGWEQPYVDRAAELMEKISASILASLASVLMYLVLRRDGNRWALPLAIVFAFGTNTWMISSQALWQHGTGELLIALALLLVASRASPMRIALLGAVCVLMAANRQPDALIAAAFIGVTVWQRRRKSVWLIAGAVVPVIAVLYYNLNFIGEIVGGYALAKPYRNDFFKLQWSGVAGLLVSPARGLLVFSPLFLFIPFGLIQRLRSPNSKALAVGLTVAVVAQLLLYSQADWRAGVSWGPRWLTDLLPILLWMLAPAPLVLRPLARNLLILAMVGSVGVQTIGAFWYTHASDQLVFAGDPSSMRGAWNPRHLPFLVELNHPRPRGELQCDARASIDRLGSTLINGAGDVPKLEPGAVIEGWAVACQGAPAKLLVLIDGIEIGSTKEFLPRADAGRAIPVNSPLGWRVFANTRGVSPGERVLQLAVHVRPASDIRIVREQRVYVTPEDVSQPNQAANTLETMAGRAAELLRERQSKDGFWLTSHTTGVRYESPQPEMNTFLTSILVDALAPVARQRSLENVLGRARQHLAAQIESNGLVRYHGLPDGPGIGTLGCAITPDVDDTSLVWRVGGAGANDSRKQPMLETIARYRDSRGLYRTWLAPREQYQCLDPGSDPNPADVVIQMHVYMMLRELDPPAAKNLCQALQRAFPEGENWIYYAQAPLLPYLRSAELKQLGCALPLPTERLAAPVAEQEIWSAAARLMVSIMASPNDANARQAIRNLLLRVGSDDFAQLRRSPPLLYHNDQSATVKRFYWSEDFGYALWLRLYEVAGVEAGSAHRPSS